MPVEGADVTIYGYGGIDSNKTDKNGLATLHLDIQPLWHKDTPEHYLSMVVMDERDVKAMNNAIEILYEYPS